MVVERAPSPAEQRTAKSPALPERVKDDNIAPSAEKVAVREAAAAPAIAISAKVAIPEPKAVEVKDKPTEISPIETATPPAVENSKREGAFADDLLAIMNDFGF
ncbi:hypothetical protein HDU86_001200 [Geranomyces michiganensis]|nr:hypothetical protein HDU86_001200 [Geranomyces michiganensis]